MALKIEELHEILLNILKEINAACCKEKIPYMLYGGTLLGAIRHAGFIPWDDDIDICVWSKDYPKLKKALDKYLPDYLNVVEPADLSPDFFDFVFRVVDKRYFWHEPTEEDRHYDNKQNHVCVDIFIINKYPDGFFEGRLYRFRKKLLYGLALGHRFKTDWSRIPFVQRLPVWLLMRVGKLLPVTSIIRWWNRILFMHRGTGMGTKCIVPNEIPGYWDIVYESQWFEKTIDREFEDVKLPVPQGYDQILTLLYGDYMIPPEDKTKYIQHMSFD